MAFDGSGTFNRLYSWIQDAAAGVNIDATRMDNEFNGLAAGLTDCLTRDGQSPATANIPLGGHKLTGLGNGTASTDACTYGQAQSLQSPWYAEAGTTQYVSSNSFKVLARNATGDYHVGRRVTALVTGGVVIGTVISSSYSAPDTTVIVAVDTNSAAVDSGLNTVRYGLLTYNNPAYLDPRTSIVAYDNEVSGALTANVALQVHVNTVVVDALSELDTTAHVVTFRYPGRYMVVGHVSVTNGTNAGILEALLYVNGSEYATTMVYLPASNTIKVPITAMVSASSGATLELYVRTSVSGCTFNTGTAPLAYLHVARLI